MGSNWLILGLDGNVCRHVCINHDELSVNCESIGFPAWILYPLAVAKILGVIAIITKKSVVLKEWAYAGFLYTLLLAITGHSIANDGNAPAPAIALALMVVSYITNRKMRKELV